MSHHRKHNKFQQSKVCTEWHLFMVYRPYQKKAWAGSECSGLLQLCDSRRSMQNKLLYLVLLSSQNHQSLDAFKKSWKDNPNQGFGREYTVQCTIFKLIGIACTFAKSEMLLLHNRESRLYAGSVLQVFIGTYTTSIGIHRTTYFLSNRHKPPRCVCQQKSLSVQNWLHSSTLSGVLHWEQEIPFP